MFLICTARHQRHPRTPCFRRGSDCRQQSWSGAFWCYDFVPLSSMLYLPGWHFSQGYAVLKRHKEKMSVLVPSVPPRAGRTSSMGPDGCLVGALPAPVPLLITEHGPCRTSTAGSQRCSTSSSLPSSLPCLAAAVMSGVTHQRQCRGSHTRRRSLSTLSCGVLGVHTRDARGSLFVLLGNHT